MPLEEMVIVLLLQQIDAELPPQQPSPPGAHDDPWQTLRNP